MSALRTFVLARIHDDEAAAQSMIDSQPAGHRWGVTAPDGTHVPAQWDPWRVLTGCMAKRLILAAHRDGCCVEDRRSRDGACYTLRVLALHWVDHPDYRQEWRPEPLKSAAGQD